MFLFRKIFGLLCHFFFEFFRWIAIFTCWPFQLILFKKKIFYEDKAVQSRRIRGGALVISNHFSVLDYILTLFVVLPRKLYIVAAEMAFKNRFLRFGMRFFGGIEANRVTKSMRFVGESADIIKKGRVVQIFPEGRITHDGTTAYFKQSYLAIALHSGAPIIPIVLDGTYHILKRSHVLIGKPIYLSDYCKSQKPSREEMVALNDMVYNKVLSLREELEARKKAMYDKRKGKKK